MRVKLKTGRAGDGFVQNPGDVIEVKDDEGERMVTAGLAEKVEDEKPAAKGK